MWRNVLFRCHLYYWKLFNLVHNNFTTVKAWIRVSIYMFKNKQFPMKTCSGSIRTSSCKPSLLIWVSPVTNWIEISIAPHIRYILTDYYIVWHILENPLVKICICSNGVCSCFTYTFVKLYQKSCKCYLA